MDLQTVFSDENLPTSQDCWYGRVVAVSIDPNLKL